MHKKKILLQFCNNNIYHLKKTNCKFQKNYIIHFSYSAYSRNRNLITSATWNRRPNALTFRIRLNAATNCRVALINLQANTNTTKAITSSNVELNANVSQLIRIPIKKNTTTKCSICTEMNWTLNKTLSVIKQRCYQNVLHTALSLSLFHLLMTKTLEVGAFSTRSTIHILSDAWRI